MVVLRWRFRGRRGRRHLVGQDARATATKGRWGYKIGRLEKAAVAISKSQSWAGFGKVRLGRGVRWVLSVGGSMSVRAEGLMGERVLRMAGLRVSPSGLGPSGRDGVMWAVVAGTVAAAAAAAVSSGGGGNSGGWDGMGQVGWRRAVGGQRDPTVAVMGDRQLLGVPDRQAGHWLAHTRMDDVYCCWFLSGRRRCRGDEAAMRRHKGTRRVCCLAWWCWHCPSSCLSCLSLAEVDAANPVAVAATTAMHPGRARTGGYGCVEERRSPADRYRHV